MFWARQPHAGDTHRSTTLSRAGTSHPEEPMCGVRDCIPMQAVTNGPLVWSQRIAPLSRSVRTAWRALGADLVHGGQQRSTACAHRVRGRAHSRWVHVSHHAVVIPVPVLAGTRGWHGVVAEGGYPHGTLRVLRARQLHHSSAAHRSPGRWYTPLTPHATDPISISPLNRDGSSA